MVTHLLWESLAAHRACKRSAAFGKSPAGKRWGALLRKLGHEAQVCEVVRAAP